MQPDKSQDQNQTHRKDSRGEKLFNWLTYGAIAGVGTFIATIPMGYWAKYGGGANLFKAASRQVQKLGKVARISENTTESAVMTTALMMGGNVMLLPVRAMEAKKPEIVEKLNEKLGEKDTIAQVKEEPAQTWGSIIKARLVAWVMVFTSLKLTAKAVGYDKFEHFENKFAETVAKVLKKPTHINGAETKVFHYGKIAALDVFATIASSMLLFAGTRFFAKKRDEKHPAPHTQEETAAAPESPPAKSFTDALQPRAENFAAAAEARKTAAEQAQAAL